MTTKEQAPPAKNYLIDAFGKPRRIVPPGEGVWLNEDGYLVVDRELRAAEIAKDALRRFGVEQSGNGWPLPVMIDAIIQWDIEPVLDCDDTMRDMVRERDGWRREPVTTMRWVKPEPFEDDQDLATLVGRLENDILDGKPTKARWRLDALRERLGVQTVDAWGVADVARWQAEDVEQYGLSGEGQEPG